MSHNTRVRTNLTAWGAGAAVTPAELDKLDQGQFQSINGDTGGVWAPTSQIQIGGGGLNVSGTFIAQGSCIIAGDELLVETTTCAFVGVTPDFRDGILVSTGLAHLYGALTVEGAATLNGAATIAGTTTLNGNVDSFAPAFTLHTGSALICNDDVTLGNSAGDVVTINGSPTFNAAAVFGSTARFNGAADFFGGSVTLHNGTDLVCNSNATLNAVNGTTTINGAATLNSTLDLYDNLRIHGAAGLNCEGTAVIQHAMNVGTAAGDLANFLGALQINNAMRFTANGRVPCRPFLGQDLNLTFVAPNANFVYVPQGTLSAARVYVISDTGAVDGDDIWFYTEDYAHAITVTPPSGGAIVIQAVFGHGADSIRFIRIDGIWRAIDIFTQGVG